MSILDRYIASHVASAIAVVLLIILGLDCLMALIDQLDRLNDHYTFAGALHYVALTAPRRLYEFIPLGGLVGAMIGLGMLASHSELTVMRAAGFSTQRILLGVFKPVLLLAVLGMVIGQFVAPHTERKAQSARAVALSGDGTFFVRGGVWHKEGTEYIHINAVQSGDVIHGVTRYEFDDQMGLLRSSHARVGRYEGDVWVLEQVQETRLLGTHTEVGLLSEERWRTGLTPDLLAVVVLEPEDLSISGLWSYTAYLDAQGINADTYLLAFWSKLLQPLSIGALVLIGISFIFGPLRSVPVGQRVISGVVLGLVFKFAQDLLGPASSVFGFPPFLAILIPILICAGAGWVLLRRAG